MSKPEPRFKMGDHVRLIATPKELEAFGIKENFNKIGYVPGKLTFTLTPSLILSSEKEAWLRWDLSSDFILGKNTPTKFGWNLSRIPPFSHSWNFLEDHFELAAPETPETSTEITENAYLEL